MSSIVNETLFAQLILFFIGIIVLLPILNRLPILDGYLAYSILSLFVILLEAFFFEALFTAFEKMQYLTIRYIVSQIVVVIGVITTINSDSDILLIPIFELLGGVFSAVLCWNAAKKLGVVFYLVSLKAIYGRIRNSFVYFLSNFSLTAFNALNTISLGIFAASNSVAFWAIAMQIIGGIQMLYSPVINAIYPKMIRTKSRKILFNSIKIFLPFVILGSTIVYFVIDIFVEFIFGINYIEASETVKRLIPVFLFGFLSMLFGWPALGVIDKQKQTTATTILASFFQTTGILCLVLVDYLSLISLCYLRVITEVLLCFTRFSICYKYRNKFNP